MASGQASQTNIVTLAHCSTEHEAFFWGYHVYAVVTKRTERNTNTVTGQRTVTEEAFNDSLDLRTSRVVRAQS
ncbi:hypothetical protein GGP41_003023 [Bipolaris sorokiniana]|uniref:Uncharacterized protein n=1 Tax=Cochliobolus sativus TaxID=45130 RepID=A0A8H5Z9V8_COCSA|nr:hypothetical protein GGP41_003023 [Bipolaris sorokiniana]